MNKKINILLIEDDEDDYFIIKELLSRITYFGYELNWVTKIEDLASVDMNKIDICIADYFLGKTTAINVLTLFKDREFNLPTIVLTGMNDREKDIEVMEAGATDYLSKENINAEKLERVIRYAIRQNSILNQFKIERNKYQKLFELNTDLIVILNGDFEVNDINNQVLQTLGVAKKSELIGLKATDLITSPNMLELLKTQKDIINLDVDLSFYNSKEISGILSLTEIFDSNNITERYQIIIKDVSEVAKAKNRLKNIEKINFSGKMAQTLAHEIRNPLSNINLSVSFLKINLEGENKYLDMVLKNAQKINEITTQFINNTKEVKLKKELIFINEVIDEAIELCLDRIELRNVKLELVHDSTKEQRVFADKEKLSIAISNIILNATEALNENPNPIIKVVSEVKGEKTTISISDNGIGISPEKLKTIFEPFATDKQSGIGVGLSSVYNIITLHDWDIDVDSKLGIGTTFNISMDLEN